ncbi:GNAT family N-acetyltransferase [Cellulomonas soli]|uniref:N-acetyltransferase n=1 Tax=Cellulomonas soli TaxID=931535 RepID=A0A512PF87_9CELL|nr:GNAT family protein [Cellulomonas soli]NYI59341.1 RimJ/RimL family protein N-acetyltransferase [Cellulomonas soli]GEP69871.1 N-acetyltransferase [Cellulomonas soli]
MPFDPLPARLETDRLVMTPEAADDAVWLARLFTARGAGVVSTAEAEDRIVAMQRVVAEHGIGARVLRAKPGREPLGYCAIIVGRGSLAEPELAYELLPEARGMGYATEGSRALLDAVFRTGRSRIWSTVRAWNGPSLRVLDSLGFVRDRVTQDAQGELVWLVATAAARGPV